MHFFMTGVGDQDVASTPLAQKWRVRTEMKENIITFQKPYIFSAFMCGRLSYQVLTIIQIFSFDYLLFYLFIFCYSEFLLFRFCWWA